MFKLEQSKVGNDSVVNFLLRFLVSGLVFMLPICVIICSLSVSFYNKLVVGIGIIAIPVWVNDMLKRRYLAFWAFFYAIVFFMYDLPYGFDMTDEPFQLVLSYFLPKGDLSVQVNPLSYKLLHLVFGIYRQPYLLYERFVAALVVSLIIYFAVKAAILRKREIDLAVYLVSLGAALGYSFNFIRFIMPYDQVAVLFFAMLIFLGYWMLGSRSIVSSLLFGMIWILSLYTRLTAMFFSFLLLIVFGYEAIKRRVVDKKILIGFSGGILIGFMVLLFLRVRLRPVILDFLKFKYNYCVPPGFDHSLSIILRKYFFDFKMILGYLIVSFPLVYVSNKILARKRSNDFNGLVLMIFLTVLFLLFIEFAYRGLYSANYKSWFFLGLAVFISLYLLLMIENGYIPWIELLLIGLMLLFSFLGSNIGVKKIAYNGALGFSLIFVFLVSDLNKISRYALYGWLLLLFDLGLSFRYYHF